MDLATEDPRILSSPDKKNEPSRANIDPLAQQGEGKSAGVNATCPQGLTMRLLRSARRYQRCMAARRSLSKEANLPRVMDGGSQSLGLDTVY